MLEKVSMIDPKVQKISGFFVTEKPEEKKTDLNFEWERTSSDRLEYVAFVPHQCDIY